MEKLIERVTAFTLRRPRNAAILLIICAGGWCVAAGSFWLLLLVR
jgi:hypothetical protein